MAEVIVRDETMSGRAIESRVLPGLPDEISARELVRLRVREEVARFNAEAGEVFHGLVRPVGAEVTPAGFVVPGGRRLDWEAQADAACAAFERNGFVMLAGDRQVDRLDEVIDLRQESTVAFIRLVALVGG
ncbi:hypothetical protein KZZ52_34940 [Dactylosporangium sp. AC04546]|uniref:hypothetical protein n=1 Tax=Dactylosporangium sp. AC04546 TaxID=2862460 RepID=UPI001EDFFC4B|nr:hypothetical protein [Dactylosporangium sp. AC04546]WVK79167.1 hypothetical protein KZZ52_34940 [Dactylosporangium sp. AC04546]